MSAAGVATEAERIRPPQGAAGSGTPPAEGEAIAIRDIAIGLPSKNLPAYPTDALVKEEEDDLDRQKKREEIATLRQDNFHRGIYASRIFTMLCAWFCLLFGVVFLAGFKLGGFVLSDSVLLGLIGGTTASVIGIFLVVVRYLYPKR